VDGSVIPFAPLRIPLATIHSGADAEPPTHKVGTGNETLVAALEARLADHAAGLIATRPQAREALADTLRALAGDRGGLCLMPAWAPDTAALAVRDAGLEPCFTDVSEAGWALEPAAARAALRRAPGRVAAILAVAPFGAPPDAAAWDAVWDATGIPVALSVSGGWDGLRAARSPLVACLGAGSVGGAGGFIATADAALARRLRRGRRLGTLQAATALEALAAWPERRDQALRRAALLRAALAALGCACLPGFGDSWAGASCVTLLPAGRSAREVSPRLATRGIASWRYWAEGCHRAPGFAYAPRTGLLPIADLLAERTLALPFGAELRGEGIGRIAASLVEAMRVA